MTAADRITEFLAPLTSLCLARPDIEAVVFWESDGWPGAPSEVLEAEETAFYAEGLLQEGFHLEWRIVALPETPELADHVKLLIWETGAAPPAPNAAPLIAFGRWP